MKIPEYLDHVGTVASHDENLIKSTGEEVFVAVLTLYGEPLYGYGLTAKEAVVNAYERAETMRWILMTDSPVYELADYEEEIQAAKDDLASFLSELAGKQQLPLDE